MTTTTYLTQTRTRSGWRKCCEHIDATDAINAAISHRLAWPDVPARAVRKTHDANSIFSTYTPIGA